MAKNAGKPATSGGLRPAKALALADLVGYQDAAIVSRTIKDANEGTLTLFSFDAGQNMSEHRAPFDAFVAILDGEAVLKIGGKDVRAKAGEIVLMPANVPHALRADKRFKMMLAMIRAE